MATFLCGTCGNPAAHALRKAVTKFTLFFIPLFPIHTKHFTQCTFCGATHRLSKDQAQHVLAANQHQPQPATAPQLQSPQPGHPNHPGH
jgi:hypothetical protein